MGNMGPIWLDFCQRTENYVRNVQSKFWTFLITNWPTVKPSVFLQALISEVKMSIF